MVEIETSNPRRRSKPGPHLRTQHDRDLCHRGDARVRGTGHCDHCGGGDRPHACCRDEPVGRSHPHRHRRGLAYSDHDPRGRRATADRSRRDPHRDADRRRVRCPSTRTYGCVVPTRARHISSDQLDPTRARTGCRARASSSGVPAADVTTGHLASGDYPAAADDRRELSNP